MGEVSIVQLDRGHSLWRWLCSKHLKAAKAKGWELKEKRKPPHEGLTCDDCPREAPMGDAR